MRFDPNDPSIPEDILLRPFIATNSGAYVFLKNEKTTYLGVVFWSYEMSQCCAVISSNSNHSDNLANAVKPIYTKTAGLACSWLLEQYFISKL